jgi:hypothetical protein
VDARSGDGQQQILSGELVREVEALCEWTTRSRSHADEVHHGRDPSRDMIRVLAVMAEKGMTLQHIPHNVKPQLPPPSPLQPSSPVTHAIPHTHESSGYGRRRRQRLGAWRRRLNRGIQRRRLKYGRRQRLGGGGALASQPSLSTRRAATGLRICKAPPL